MGRSLRPALLYDPRPGFCHDHQTVNDCDIAFVCVPTPPGKGGRCDVSIVEEVVDWLETPLIVLRPRPSPARPTVCEAGPASGSSSNRSIAGNRPAIRTPTSPGRSSSWAGPRRTAWPRRISTSDSARHDAVRLLRRPQAELAKYMENAYLAMKVTFVNEFYNIARTSGRLVTPGGLAGGCPDQPRPHGRLPAGLRRPMLAEGRAALIAVDEARE